MHSRFSDLISDYVRRYQPNANLIIRKRRCHLVDSTTLTVDNTTFSVRLADEAEIPVDKIGDPNYKQLGRCVGKTRMKKKRMYVLNYMSNPISYSKLMDLLADRIVSNYSSSYQSSYRLQVLYERLVPSRIGYVLGASSATSSIFKSRLSDRFFHSQRSYLQASFNSNDRRSKLRFDSGNKLWLFHGPSGNGKSYGVEWLGRMYRREILLMSVDLVPSNISLRNYILYRIDSSYTHHIDDMPIYVIDNVDTVTRIQFLNEIIRVLDLSMAPFHLIVTVRDRSNLNPSTFKYLHRFKSIAFDYPNAEVMNQISTYYYQRPYLGSIPKSIPIDTIIEYARTCSYEEFSTRF